MYVLPWISTFNCLTLTILSIDNWQPKFEALGLVTMKMAALSNVTASILAQRYQLFGRNCCQLLENR